MLNFAIIGFGGLGKTHFRNVAKVTEKVGDIKLVALCDIEEKAFHVQTNTNVTTEKTELDLSMYHLYTDVEEMLDNEKLDFVITALPTYIHEKVGVMVMERGIHLFSEKPMALTVEQAENMLKTARKNNVKLMIGQCVRYNPRMAALKELIDSKKYGEVVRAAFHRLSPMITWSWQNWYLDEAKSGGAALDLHVHDVDFINYIMGMPKAVTSVATNGKTKHDYISTIYHYDGQLISAESGWEMPKGYPFSRGYTVKLETAAVVLSGNDVKLYPDGEKPVVIEIPDKDEYVEEMIDFIHCIRTGEESKINPPEESLKSLRIALAEKISADTGMTIALEI